MLQADAYIEIPISAVDTSYDLPRRVPTAQQEQQRSVIGDDLVVSDYENVDYGKVTGLLQALPTPGEWMQLYHASLMDPCFACGRG